MAQTYLKDLAVFTLYLKYDWPFFNIINERVKKILILHTYSTLLS